MIKRVFLSIVAFAALSVSAQSSGMGILQAIGNNDLARVKKIIGETYSGGTIIESFSAEGWTPLHIACLKNNTSLEIIRFLLDNGARWSVNNPDFNGYTPMHWACMHDLARVELLLEYDADKSINLQNKYGKTPVDLAFESNKKDVLQAFFNVACKEGFLDIVKFLIKQEFIDVNNKNNDGEVPLHNACKNGHLEIVRELLGHKDIDVNLNISSKDACFYAYNRNKSISNFMSILLLLPLWGYDDTPLHVACRRGNLDIVRELLNHKNIDVNKFDSRQSTPLLQACCCGNVDIVIELLNNPKVDVNKVNKFGSTPLRETLIHTSEPPMTFFPIRPEFALKKLIIKALLKNGANIDQKTFDVARDAAARLNDPEIFADLKISKELDDSKNKLGLIDSKEGNSEVFEFLCKRFYAKHGRKYSSIKNSLNFPQNKNGLSRFGDCRIMTQE